jgi:hypothetical protein
MMQAQAQHAGIGSIFRLLLTWGIFAVLVSVFGPLLRERPSPSSYEWGNEPSPQASPSGTPAGQENGAPNGERDFSSQAEPRPTDVPQAMGPVEAGTSSSWGLTGDDAYDCNAMGVDLAQVNLANIKTFMDLAYEEHLQAQQMGDFALAQEKEVAYTQAKTDLEKKKWRCLHCANEIGCSGE